MTGPLAGGWLLVDPTDVGLLAFLAREGARSVGARRPLPTQVAELLAAVEQAAADARVSAAGHAGVLVAAAPGSLLTTVEVAEVLRVSERSVRRMCRSGALLAERRGPVWTVDADSVAALALARRAVA